jgi:hypothetical protein
MGKRNGSSRKARRRDMARRISQLERHLGPEAAQPRPSPARPPDPKDRRRPIGKRLLQAAGAIAAVLGGYAAWAELQPSLEVEVQQPAGLGERFSPYFVVRNTGLTPALEVTFNCMDIGYYHREPGAYWPSDYYSTKPAFEGPEYMEIGTLSPGRQVLRRCEVREAPAGFERTENSQLAPVITHRSYLNFGTSVRGFMFELKRGEADEWKWSFLQESLSKSEAKELAERGGEVWVPDPDNHSMKTIRP